MGTPEFAVPSLQILHTHQYRIAAVVTGPDKARGRGQHVTSTPVCTLAGSLGLPVLQPEDFGSPEFISSLKELNADLFVIVAFRILPQDVFEIPRLGSFNLHASLLPKYRGAAPISRAIMNGETETGVTTFLLRRKVDTGSLLLQTKVPILPEDDAGALHDRLAEKGSELVLQTVRGLEGGMLLPREQDDSLATPAPKILKEDCRIDWRRPAVEIHNQIRALSPYPAAFTMHDGKMVKLFRSALTGSPSHDAPGSIRIEGGRLEVSTRDLMLSVLEIRPEGRKRMTTAEFLRGYAIHPGESFR